MRISDWSSDVCSSDLRLFRHPDRLRAAKCEYEPHLPVAGRGYREAAGPVGRRAADRAAGPADHRPYERPDLARPARTPPPLLSRGRDPRRDRAVRHARKPGDLVAGADADWNSAVWGKGGFGR